MMAQIKVYLTKSHFSLWFYKSVGSQQAPKNKFSLQEAPCELSGASWNLLRLPASSLGPSGATAGQAHISWICNQIILKE